MRDVAIIGVGMIPFGRRDEDSLMDMLAYASLKALDDAGLGDKGVNAVYVGNMGAGILQHQTSIASSLVDRLSLLPAAADVVENGPASGGSAVKNGLLAVASGYYDIVLVAGGEKMREVTGWRATDFVATMAHPQVEYPYGITLPGMGGMFTRLYMEKYGVTPRASAGGLSEEPGNGRSESVRPRGDDARPRRHLRQPACRCQQSHRG